MKRCSTSLVIRKMQTKTQLVTSSYQLGWLKSKQQTIKSVDRDVEKLKASYTDGKIVKWCTLENSLKLKMLNMNLYDIEILFLNMYPKELKTYIHAKTCIQ